MVVFSHSFVSSFFFFYSSLFPFNLFPKLLTYFPILYSIFWEPAVSSPVPSCVPPLPTKHFLDTYPRTIASLGLPFRFIKPHVVSTSSFFHASFFFLLDPVKPALSEFSHQSDKHLLTCMWTILILISLLIWQLILYPPNFSESFISVTFPKLWMFSFDPVGPTWISTMNGVTVLAMRNSRPVWQMVRAEGCLSWESWRCFWEGTFRPWRVIRVTCQSGPRCNLCWPDHSHVSGEGPQG